MPQCKHLRPLGACLRCSWDAGLKGKVIKRASDTRLVQVASGRRLHYIAAAVLAETNDVWCAETGLKPLLVVSGWRRRRWANWNLYVADLSRRYAARLAELLGHKPVRSEIVKYGRRYLAFNSLHFTGLALDFGNHGLEPVSKTVDEQRQTKAFKWLLEYSNRPQTWRDEDDNECRLVNYANEPWHWEVFISEEVWRSTCRLG